MFKTKAVNPNQERLISDLLSIREILNKGWCQDSYARNSSDQEVSTYDSAATKWCILGSISKLAFEDRHSGNREHEMKHAIARELVRRGFISGDYSLSYLGLIARYNDYEFRTQKQILSLIDKTIEWEMEHA